MERRFFCTGCGKCCHGLVPLGIDDALAHADRFPLAMVWTPVRQGRRSYRLAAELGVTIELGRRKLAALQVAPTAIVPPSFSCPELTEEGLCRIHDTKPQRCRTMPFSAYRDETDQVDLIVPQPDWDCDTSQAAPVIYRDKTIIERKNFEIERRQLIRDAVHLKPYAEWLLDSVPALRMELKKVAMKPTGGQVFVAFSTLIPRLPKVDIYALAEKQYPLMEDFAQRTKGDPDLKRYHRHYADCAVAWEKIVRGRA